MFYIFVSSSKKCLNPVENIRKEDVSWCIHKDYSIASEYHYRTRNHTRIVDCYSFKSDVTSSITEDGAAFRVWHGYLLDEKPFQNQAAMSPKECYYGVYSHGVVTQSDCWFATDEIGLSPLYYSKEEDLLFISNNPHLIATYKRKLGLKVYVEPTLAIWQTIGITNESDHTGYRDIYRVRPWRYIVVDCDDHIAFPEKPRLLTSAGYEEMCHESIKQLRLGMETINSRYTDYCQQLTGGIDSRTVLSFILDSGKQGEYRFYTDGWEQNPDCIVAGMLAQKYGLRHAVSPREEAINGIPDVDALVEEVCMADAMETGFIRMKGFRGIGNGSVLLNGFGSDFSKSYGFAKSFRAFMERKFKGKGPVDYSNLSYEQYIHGHECFGYSDADRYFLTEGAIETSLEYRKYIFAFNYNRFPENLSYADSMSAYRWRNHSCSLAQAENNCVFLYAPVVLETSRMLTPELRQNAKLYFDMIWRIKPDICFVPFENRVIDPRLYEDFPVEIKEIFSKIPPATGSIVSEAQITLFDVILPTLKRDLIDMLPSYVFDYIKRDALEARLKEDNLRFERRNFPLMSLYSVAKWDTMVNSQNER